VRPDRFLGRVGPECDDHRLTASGSFLERERFFESVFVVRIGTNFTPVSSMDFPSAPRTIFVVVSGTRLRHTAIFIGSMS
jgi:hypothetical protein